jgi:hypothetical protein
MKNLSYVRNPCCLDRLRWVVDSTGVVAQFPVAAAIGSGDE